MAKYVCLLLLTLCCLSIVNAAAKQKRKLPPNTFEQIPDDDIKRHPRFRPNLRHRADIPPPERFDARVKWPNCKSIKAIRDQAQCGSCWAVSATSVLSDRLCIASGQKTQDFISATQAASCTRLSYTPDENCANGGDPVSVYKYSVTDGLSTGGRFNSNGSEAGCVPYNIPPHEAVGFSCAKKCTNTDYKTPLAKDAKIIDSYWINYKKSTGDMSQGEINDAVKMMKLDLVANGPITACFSVWTDFQGWNKNDGPYRGPKPGEKNMNGHAIKIIGWDKTKSGIPYWLISNSWSEEEGDGGIYWIELGKNVVGIEQAVSAPIISLPNTCVSSSFCSSPIDYAVRLSPKDAKMPVFLFQGNCTLKVTVKPDGKMTAQGVATPLAKQIITAPVGSIVSHSYVPSQDSLMIVSSNGETGAGCKTKSPTAAKSSCEYVTTYTPNTWTEMEFFHDGVMQKYSSNPQDLTILHDDTATQDSFIRLQPETLLSAYYKTIISMVNVDGTKMNVIGKDAEGHMVSGVMSYPKDHEDTFKWVTKPVALSQMLTC